MFLFFILTINLPFIHSISESFIVHIFRILGPHLYSSDLLGPDLKQVMEVNR